MSTVIRGGSPPEKVIRRLEAIDLSDHLAVARERVGRARREASTILRSARAQARKLIDASLHKGYDAGFEKGRKEGFEEGFRAGRAEGHQAAHQQAIEEFRNKYESLAQSLQTLLAELESMKESIRLAASRDALQFAIDLAKKITFQIGSLHRESAQANLQRALAFVDQKSVVIARVHPLDCEALSEFASNLKDQLGHARAIRLVADESMSPGGCLVRTESGEINATLEAQLEELTGVLVGGSGHHG